MSYVCILHCSVETAQEAVIYGQRKAVIPAATATGRSGISTQLIFMVQLNY